MLRVAILVAFVGFSACKGHETPDELQYLTKKLEKLVGFVVAEQYPEMTRLTNQLNMSYYEPVGYFSTKLYSKNKVVVDDEQRPAVSSYLWVLPPNQKVPFFRNNVSSCHLTWVRGPPIRVYVINEITETIESYDIGNVLDNPSYRILCEVPSNALVAMEILSDEDYTLISGSSTPAYKDDETETLSHDTLVAKYPMLKDQLDQIYSTAHSAYVKYNSYHDYKDGDHKRHYH